jgi:hypothetical protein
MRTMTSDGRDQQVQAEASDAGVGDDQDVSIWPDDDALVDAVDAACRSHLASPILSYEFFHRGAASVHGVRLADDRRVVLKLHPAWLDVEVLQGMREVQRYLYQRAFPAPEPLAGPFGTPFGVATVDALVAPAPLADGHDPAVRRLAAATLALLIDETRPFGAETRLPALVPYRRLYPASVAGHHLDLAVSEGVEWIDDLAASARGRFRDDGRRLVAHGDWSARNLAVHAGKVQAVFGWDSLAFDVEPVLVGHAAVAHTGEERWMSYASAPSPDEVRAFVDDYEDATGHRFRGAARETLFAAATYGACCMARLEAARADVSAVSEGRPTPSVSGAPGSYLALVHHFGEELLRG